MCGFGHLRCEISFKEAQKGFLTIKKMYSKTHMRKLPTKNMQCCAQGHPCAICRQLWLPQAVQKYPVLLLFLLLLEEKKEI